MKVLVLVLSLFSASAFAQSKTMHSGLVDLSFAQGGLHFGGSYEYNYNGSQGLGGTFQYYQKKDATTANPGGETGYMIAGAFTGYHFFKGDWDFSLAPGFNIVNIDFPAANAQDKTGFGPSTTIALTQALNERVSLGFAWSNYWVWFGEDIRGMALSDLNFRVKVGF